jgi:hypothetical protein
MKDRKCAQKLHLQFKNTVLCCLSYIGTCLPSVALVHIVLGHMGSFRHTLLSNMSGKKKAGSSLEASRHTYSEASRLHRKRPVFSNNILFYCIIWKDLLSI